MVDTCARLLCQLGASCPLHQQRKFPAEVASSPTPDSNEVQNLLQDLWAHLWTGSHRNPSNSCPWLSWCVSATGTATWGWNLAAPRVPQGAEPGPTCQFTADSTFTTYHGFTMGFDIWLASVPTVLFLKLPNCSWVFYTNCRNRLKPWSNFGSNFIKFLD